MAIIIKWCNDNQGFLSAVLSIVAVFAAIGIPAFIAHRQNKIALFDKRFEVYLLLQKIDTFNNSIRSLEFKKDLHENSVVCLINWINNGPTYFECLISKKILLDHLDNKTPDKGTKKMDVYIELVPIIRGELNTLQKGMMLYKGQIPLSLKKLADTYWELLHSLLFEYLNPNNEHDIDTKCEAFKDAARKIARLMFLRDAVHKQLRY